MPCDIALAFAIILLRIYRLTESYLFFCGIQELADAFGYIAKFLEPTDPVSYTHLKGVEMHVRKVAPLGDPMELNVRGYELSVRKADAAMIEVE